MRVLLLGGTGEARELARLLHADGVDVVSSLAGRVSRPRLPVGQVRVGGFGGVQGLTEALAGFDAVVDATHPFAATISAHAAAACHDRGLPLLRLERAPWPPQDHWHRVPDHPTAAAVTAGLGRRPVLTVGRQALPDFTGPLAHHAVLARVVDPPQAPVPPTWTLRTSRGPYAPDAERALLTGHRADVLVTKNSGGTWTWPKMAAAADLGVPVVVVDRPPGPAGVQTVSSPQQALQWVRAR